jgi:hypothetical protein
VDQNGRRFRKPFTPTEEDFRQLRAIEDRAEEFVRRNKLDDKVARILKNMIPGDVETLLEQGVDLAGCRNPTAVVVSRVRRIETAAGRPSAMKRYDRRNGASPEPNRARDDDDRASHSPPSRKDRRSDRSR